MNRKLPLFGWSMLALLSLSTSCKHDPITPLEDAPIISFKKDIQPVLVANCAQSGCHGPSSEINPKLITYEEVAAQTQPGKASKSNLYQTLTATSGDVMKVHKDHRLSDSKIKQIYLWITQGSTNN